MNEVDRLQLISVPFDFPSNKVMIPLSWKLTKNQKRNIDETWEEMVGKKPHKSIGILDNYFYQNGHRAVPEEKQPE